MTAREDWPIAVRSVELREPLEAITDVAGYPKTRVFVFDEGTLIGSTDIGNAHRPISATRLRDSIANGLAYTLMRRAMEQELPVAEAAWLSGDVAVSVVIPTCNRPEDLRRCLAAVQNQATSRR